MGLEGRGKDRMGPEGRDERRRKGGKGRGGIGWFPKSPPLKNPRSATVMMMMMTVVVVVVVVVVAVAVAVAVL